MQKLATALAVVTVAFVAQACCGGLDADEADKTLRVTVAAPLDEANPDVPAQKLCGAEVIAHGDDGEQIPLEEIEDGDGGCEYVAEVDPRTVYTIEATHPEAGIAEDPSGVSNPACSTPTAPEDVDNELVLERDAALADPLALERR